jgi:hypothetical protein
MHVRPEPVNGKVCVHLDVEVGVLRMRYTVLLSTESTTELCSALLNVMHRVTRSGDSGGSGEA